MTRIHKPIINIFLTIFIFTLQTFSAQNKFTVVLDAGHGGADFGANRYYEDLGSVIEKDIALSVVLDVGKKLEKSKDFKVLYTRKNDSYPSFTSRTDLANKNKAEIFVSIHCNAAKNSAAYGTETFVQGPAQNRENLEVAKAENDVVFLDERDKEIYASYDPNAPESLIALKIQQSKYLERSLFLGAFVEENFTKKDGRFSRGVKQQNLHVLRRNAMPSVLIEIGFISNYEDAKYILSEKGHEEIVNSIYEAIISYKKKVERASDKIVQEPPKPVEKPLKNDFRILLMSTPIKYSKTDPALRGLNYILVMKEGNEYKYYYSTTNFASVKDNNLKTAKDAGFKNATAISFVPNQTVSGGYYTIEILATKEKLPNNAFPTNILKDVERVKDKNLFYYNYGKVNTLEDAVKLQKELENKGIENTVIKKVINSK